MPRTTEDLLSGVIELDATFDVDPHILTAHTMVNTVLATSGYDDSLLELIERYLAAHFCRIHAPVATSESVSGVSESFTVSIGQQLKQTTYGQQVLVLDVNGYFAELQGRTEQGRSRRRLGVSWLGS